MLCGIEDVQCAGAARVSRRRCWMFPRLGRVCAFRFVCIVINLLGYPLPFSCCFHVCCSVEEAVEGAVMRGDMTSQAADRLLSTYTRRMHGYTYMAPIA